MDTVRTICALLLVGLVGVILGTAMTGKVQNPGNWLRTLTVCVVMLGIAVTIVVTDLYIMQVKTRHDLLTYINECNQKYIDHNENAHHN